MRNIHRFKLALAGAVIFFLTIPAFGQDVSEEAAYIRVTNERADKIVAELGLADPDKAIRVRDLIAQQYRDLSKIHDARDAGIELTEKRADKKIARLHRRYLAGLSAELSREQVSKVKDGMTYGVLPLTYKAFLEMLPSLTEDQKATIMDYLVIAREKAMDGGSSEEKHHIFGDYKGKINNYLSAEGYDLKKAGEEWKKRRESRN